MKLLTACILFWSVALAWSGQKLPDEIERAFVKNNPYLSREDAMSMDDPRFVDYILKNWRWIAEEIEILPEVEGDIPDKGVAFNASVMAFAETCQKLPPLEYLDFLDQMLVHYEQGRISDTAFELMLLAQLEKHDFLSVNYEHPRVAAILKKANRLTPAKNKALKSCLEDMASGALADNYKTNREDDAPLPQTLPGIKLKRPWGSLIKRYERVTGKKVPPDPDFPEETSLRPERRPGQSDSGSGVEEVVELTPLGKSLLGGILALVAAGTAWGFARWRRQRGR